MSRSAGRLAALILGVGARAMAGWIVDGVPEGQGGSGGVYGQAPTNEAGTAVSLISTNPAATGDDRGMTADAIRAAVTNQVGGTSIRDNSRYAVTNSTLWWWAGFGTNALHQTGVTSGGIITYGVSFPGGPWAPPQYWLEVRDGSITADKLAVASDGKTYGVKDGVYAEMAAGGIDAAAATNIAKTVYSDPWFESTALTHAGTVTVSRTSGKYNHWLLTGNGVMAFDVATYPTNGHCTVAVTVNRGANTLSRGTGIESNSWNALTVAASTWTPLVFYKGYGETEFRVKQ